jgi:hypothetical protein
MEIDDVVDELGTISDKLDMIISRLNDIVDIQTKILREVE